jgi:uncharacterized protein (TIGR02271 family)
MAGNKTTVKEIRRKDTPGETAGIPGRSQKQDQMTIPVIEENLHIDKKLVEKGKVKIRKTVIEEDVAESFPAYHENVTIDRVEINKYVDAVPEVRNEGLTTIIPVIKEVMVVEKKLMLVEEIRITRQRDEVSVEIKDKVRKERVEITRTDPDSSGN